MTHWAAAITHEGKITAYTYDETSRLIRAEYPAHSGKEETDLAALFEAGVDVRTVSELPGHTSALKPPPAIPMASLTAGKLKEELSLKWRNLLSTQKD